MGSEVVCLPQVFKPAEGSYTFQDKYYGRKISVDNFTSALASFFHDGRRLLYYHIPEMLRKLYRLATIISHLHRYRFYAASLLFIYDGDEEVQQQYQRALGDGSGGDVKAKRRQRRQGRVNIRLIDMAHCTTGDDFLLPSQAASAQSAHLPRATFPPHHESTPDCGALLGQPLLLLPSCQCAHMTSQASRISALHWLRCGSKSARSFLPKAALTLANFLSLTTAGTARTSGCNFLSGGQGLVLEMSSPCMLKHDSLHSITACCICGKHHCARQTTFGQDHVSQH